MNFTFFKGENISQNKYKTINIHLLRKRYNISLKNFHKNKSFDYNKSECHTMIINNNISSIINKNNSFHLPNTSKIYNDTNINNIQKNYTVLNNDDNIKKLIYNKNYSPTTNYNTKIKDYYSTSKNTENENKINKSFNNEDLKTTISLNSNKNKFDIRNILYLKKFNNFSSNTEKSISKKILKYDQFTEQKKNMFYIRLMIPKLELKNKLIKNYRENKEKYNVNFNNNCHEKKQKINNSFCLRPKIKIPNFKKITKTMDMFAQKPNLLPSRYYSSIRKIQCSIFNKNYIKNEANKTNIKTKGECRGHKFYVSPDFKRGEILHGSEIYTLYKLIDNVKGLELKSNLKIKKDILEKMSKSIINEDDIDIDKVLNKKKLYKLNNTSLVSKNRAKEKVKKIFVLEEG